MTVSPPASPATVQVHGAIRSVLIPVDLSPLTELVLQRAAFLPLAPNARITLLHVLSEALPSAARERARADAIQALEREVASLRAKCAADVQFDHRVEDGEAAAKIASYVEQMTPDLLLVGRGGKRGAREIFLGSTAERVIRQAHVPVLTVRSAASLPYQRPALSVAVEHDTDVVLPMLLRTLGSPLPPLHVVHAYDVPFGSTLYPSLSVDESGESQDQFRRAARERIDHLLKAAATRHPAMPTPQNWKVQVAVGSPRTVVVRAVEQQQIDILALGTRARRGLPRLFVGSVAGDLLRLLLCDVLVVPPE
jgi:nucleotide-binding universal stress UspA family protein